MLTTDKQQLPTSCTYCLKHDEVEFIEDRPPFFPDSYSSFDLKDDSDSCNHCGKTI